MFYVFYVYMGQMPEIKLMMKIFETRNGIKVMPSGLRLSPGKRPDGSLETGTPCRSTSAGDDVVKCMLSLDAVAYLGGGTVRWPTPIGSTMKIFYRRLYIKRCFFAKK